MTETKAKKENPKYEYRNPKQYLMTKIQMIQTICATSIVIITYFLF